VAGAATGHDPDVALDGRIGSRDGASVFRHRLEHCGMSRENPIEHLVHEGVRVVDDLLHRGSGNLSGELLANKEQ